MWKWVVWGLLGLVCLIAASTWWGYQKMQSSLSGDGIERVSIAAPPERVFAPLANGDSIAIWMAEGNTVTTARHGLLLAGDSVRVALRTTLGMPARPMIWHVTGVVPGVLLVRQLVSDTSHRVVAIRRDSLAAFGDSTSVISSVVSPLFDSLRTARPGPKNTSRDGMLGLSSNLMLVAFRVQSKLELLRLKAHIEGTHENISR